MGQVFGLYTLIRANRIRSRFLLAGLFLLVYVLAFAGALFAEAVSHNYALQTLLQLAWRDTLAAAPFVTLGTLAWIFVARRWHQKMIDLVTGAHPVTRQEEPRLYNLLENLCISRGLPMPRLEILDTPALNAFATGLTPAQYSITVTTGLREALDDQEMEAVLAHELTHIRNEDVNLMVTAMVIAGVVAFFAEFFFRIGIRTRWSGGGSRSSDRDDDKKGTGGAFLAIIIAAALIAVAWFLSQAIKFALSRTREFMADAGAVELTKNPDAMISALLKIDGRGEIETAPSGVMEMCLDNPRSGFADLFATHPPIAARVESLVRNAGGHLPDPAAPALDHEPAGGPWGPPADELPHASPWGPRPG
jgi:heat shock protein HtpX